MEDTKRNKLNTVGLVRLNDKCDTSPKTPMLLKLLRWHTTILQTSKVHRVRCPMPRPPHIDCDVIVTDDKKTVYHLRIDSGPLIEKHFEEFDKLYKQVSHLLPATHSTPPRKRLLQIESKLQEKRKTWILSFSQTLLSHQSSTLQKEIKDFYGITDPDEDNEYFDLGPKEIKSAIPSDFDFKHTIGEGSFGRVYQVEHRATGKVYAMKVLSKEHIRKKNEVKHVMAELSVLKANIHHPFLVSLHFSFQTKDKLYFVLDHVNGGELFSRIQKEKKFDENRCRFYAADIASAIGYLHENNIIYRDLKPENLLLDKYGYIVLCDFGLCKENIGIRDTTSTFCGTPEYLAPEIILKKPYDRSVDWWCVGSVLYEMLYGLPPFFSKNHQEMFDRIVNEQLRFRYSISTTSTDIITQFLQKDKTKRLGYRYGFFEVKEHPFFASIDWDKLLAREIRASYIPRIKNEWDINNVDDIFKKKAITASVAPPKNIPSSVRDHDFPGFTFVAPPNIQ